MCIYTLIGSYRIKTYKMQYNSLSFSCVTLHLDFIIYNIIQEMSESLNNIPDINNVLIYYTFCEHFIFVFFRYA